MSQSQTTPMTAGEKDHDAVKFPPVVIQAARLTVATLVATWIVAVLWFAGQLLKAMQKS